MTVDPQKPSDSDTASFAERAIQRARGSLKSAPETVGPYRILEKLGQGGMGEVYRAEQRQPIRREVALKVIKLGMDTKQVIARFSAERQALAMMDHPNIAKVFDAGADETGRPYFVMEYVKGKPITDYADEKQLSLDDRLKLFEQVCHAIQHAHHKGVIHRDLKPSNVLVSTQDGRPHAKVIDFGIAKAMNQPLTDITLFTEHAMMVGTPAYMSPEQAEGNIDIDTRSDVYSLGVLLYELLTGHTPFDPHRLRKAAIIEVARILRDEEPPKPSTCISAIDQKIDSKYSLKSDLSSTSTAPTKSSSAKLVSLAKARCLAPESYAKNLRGELDWIVMKALEKDRTRRYTTPADFAEDIQRHLDGIPIEAAPPSFSYRTYKFIKHYRAQVVTLATIGLLLLSSTVAISLLALRLQSQIKTATTAQKVAEKARDSEEEQRAKADQMTERNQELLYSANINFATQSWNTGAVPRVIKLLEQSAPLNGARDLRSFPWYSLWHRCLPYASTTILRHETSVNAIAYSCDGSQMACALDDGSIELWNTNEKSHIRNITTDLGALRLLCFAKNDTALVAWGIKGLTVLPLIDGSLPITKYSQNDPIVRVAISESNGHICLGKPKGKVVIWDPFGHRADTLIDAHDHEIVSIAWARKAEIIATGDAENEIRVWNAVTGERINSDVMIGGPDHDTALALSPDGKFVVANGYQRYHQWECVSGNRIRTVYCHENEVINCINWSNDGSQIATVGTDATVCLHDSKTGAQTRKFQGHKGSVRSLAFSPSTKILASGGMDGAVMLWDIAATKKRDEFNPHSFGVTALAVSPKNSLVVTGDENGVLCTWDHQSLEISDRTNEDFPRGDTIRGISFFPDGERILVSSNQGRVDVWNIKPLTKISEIAKPIRGSVLNRARGAVSNSGKYVLYTNDGKSLCLCENANMSQRILVDVSHVRLQDIGISPNSEYFVAIGSSKTNGGVAMMWSTITGKLVGTYEEKSNAISSFAFSPSSNQIALGLGSMDGLGGILLCDVPNVKLSARLEGEGETTNCITYSPDSRTLVSSNVTGTVRFWGLGSLAEEGGIRVNAPSKIAFDSTGKTLTIAESSGRIALFHASKPTPDALDSTLSVYKLPRPSERWPVQSGNEFDVRFRKALAQASFANPATSRSVFLKFLKEYTMEVFDSGEIDNAIFGLEEGLFGRYESTNDPWRELEVYEQLFRFASTAQRQDVLERGAAAFVSKVLDFNSEDQGGGISVLIASSELLSKNDLKEAAMLIAKKTLPLAIKQFPEDSTKVHRLRRILEIEKYNLLENGISETDPSTPRMIPSIEEIRASIGQEKTVIFKVIQTGGIQNLYLNSLADYKSHNCFTTKVNFSEVESFSSIGIAAPQADLIGKTVVVFGTVKEESGRIMLEVANLSSQLQVLDNFPSEPEKYFRTSAVLSESSSPAVPLNDIAPKPE